MRFDRGLLRPGDILCERGSSKISKSIRGIIGSWSNHNGLIVKSPALPDGIAIAEALHPKSLITPLEVYEREVTDGKSVVRILRPCDPMITDEERLAVSENALTERIGVKYPVVSLLRMWRLRFSNNLRTELRGQWCTVLAWDAWDAIRPGVFDRIPDGKKKLNPTPRTFENRLMAGNVSRIDEAIID